MIWMISAGAALAIVGLVALFLILRLGIAVIGKALEFVAWLLGKLLLLLVQIPFWIYDGIAWLLTDIPYRFGRYGTVRYARAVRRKERAALRLAEAERTAKLDAR